MKKLRTFILEDDPDDLELLTELLSGQEYANDLVVTAIATCFKDAVRILKQQQFDLSILDFELDNNYDLDDLVEITGTNSFGIVALHTKTTGRSHKSAEILKMDIFMGKPFSEKGMFEFMKKLKEVAQTANGPARIEIRENGETIFLDPDEVLYAMGFGNYQKVVCRLRAGKVHSFTIRKTMAEFERLLADSRFVRCHNSYIINIEKVVKTGTGNEVYFDLYDKTLVAHHSEKYRDALVGKGILKSA